MQKIEIKTEAELKIMREGGKKLALVKEGLRSKVKTGVSAYEIEEEASRLIKSQGAVECFKMVPGYSWATCVNVNEGVVHGIPKKSLIFKDGDLVSVDVGLLWKGYNLDTSFSVALTKNSDVVTFLEVGKRALKSAISVAMPGSRIFDISKKIEDTLHGAGLNPIKGLVGHGIGKKLHEYPYIPCVVEDESPEETPQITVGNTLAVEVMYTKGTGEIVVEEDGWTIKASDGKITGLFEDTIEITEKGPSILTDSNVN